MSAVGIRRPSSPGSPRISDAPADQPIEIVWSAPSRRISFPRVILSVIVGLPALCIVFSLGSQLGEALGGWIGPNLGNFVGFACSFAAAIGIGAIVHGRIERADRIRVQACLDDAGDDTPRILQASLRFMDTTSTRGLEAACTQLVIKRHMGLCVRFAPAGDHWVVAPIETTFEALPIDEFDPRFQQFRASPTLAPPSSGMLEAAATRAGMPETAQTVRRITLRGSGMIALFGILFAAELHKAIKTGVFDWMVYIWGAILIGNLIQAARGNSAAGSGFLLLPGGMLRRSSHNFGSAYRLHVFDRRRSVLCVAPAERNHWHWFVADEATSAGSKVTRVEIEVMLAARLSPLRPPSVEQLAELA